MICRSCNRTFNPDNASDRCPHIPYSFNGKLEAYTLGPTASAIDALKDVPTLKTILSQHEIYCIGMALDHVVNALAIGQLVSEEKQLDATLQEMLALFSANMEIDTGK